MTCGERKLGRLGEYLWSGAVQAGEDGLQGWPG